MLSEKKISDNNLEPVKKGSAKVIRLKKAGKTTAAPEQQEESKKVLPPLNQFNSSYFKGRDNDIL